MKDGKRLVTVFTGRVEEMYLYVDRREALERVPPPLLERFGTVREVMTLLLGPERRLARVEAADVLRAIESDGFYLQLPPPRERPAIGPDIDPDGD